MEVSLDFVAKTISDLISEVSAAGDKSERLLKLEDFVKRLEEERAKIDVFKRELPLSMLLVNDAIERLREEEKVIKRGVIEEFISPLKKKKDSDDEEGGRAKSESDFSEKKKWMSSAQLWLSSNVDSDPPHTQISSVSALKQPRGEEEEGEEEEEEEEERCSIGVSGGGGNCRRRGGAFMPFKMIGAQSGSGSGSSKSNSQVVPSLSLRPPMAQLGGSNSKTFLTDQVKLIPKPQTPHHHHHHHQQQQQQQQTTQSHQPFRKQRRCWSEELHRRFTDALQQLGGSQAATPKQIRELMQVEGLTNDEVKSHLQKYRLHVKKLPNSSAAQGGSGLWMTQDHSGDNSKANGNISQSASPQGPLGASGSNRALSNTGGDSTEAEDDERSDGHSWRGGGCGRGRNHRAEEEEDV